MPQVDGAPTIVSDRYANQVIVGQTSTDIDGDQARSLVLPAGLGQVLISEVEVNVSSIATMIATPEAAKGVQLRIVDGSGVIRDFLGSATWRVINATRLCAQVIPDTPVIWKDGEAVRLLHQELDTNAAPTADEEVAIRCLRMVSGSEGYTVPEFLLTS